MSCRSREPEMVTRREFVAQLTVASAAIVALCAAPGAAEMAASSAQPASVPVVSIHMDRPYIDPTGMAKPYYPPCGLRSAEPAARLSEEAFRRMQCYA